MPLYVDGFVVPVPKKKLEAYREMSKKAGKVWKEHGAIDYVECVADDVKKGKVDILPAECEAEAERDRGVLVDHLQVACASRPCEQEGDEGPAYHRHG